MLACGAGDETPADPANPSGDNKDAGPSDTPLTDKTNKFIAIPQTTFDMGNSLGEKENKSYAKIELRAFQINRFEVTAEEYQACVEASVCSKAGTYVQCNYLQEGRANYPINCVTWEQARQYCQWKGGDLPTEAQWELAARGTDHRIYPWGNEEPAVAAGKRANCENVACKESVDGSSEVGSYPAGASPYALYDMAGNVHEWTRDYYLPSFFERCLRTVCSNLWNNEAGSEGKTIRGGSFLDPATELRTYARAHRGTLEAGSSIGFRCVLETL